jgi:hypothetical protein
MYKISFIDKSKMILIVNNIFFYVVIQSLGPLDQGDLCKL